MTSIEQVQWPDQAQFPAMIDAALPKLLSGVQTGCSGSEEWTTTLEASFSQQHTQVSTIGEPFIRFKNKVSTAHRPTPWLTTPLQFATISPLEHPSDSVTTAQGFGLFQQRVREPSDSQFAYVQCDEFLHCEPLRAEVTRCAPPPPVARRALTAGVDWAGIGD